MFLSVMILRMCYLAEVTTSASQGLNDVGSTADEVESTETIESSNDGVTQGGALLPSSRLIYPEARGDFLYIDENGKEIYGTASGPVILQDDVYLESSFAQLVSAMGSMKDSDEGDLDGDISSVKVKPVLFDEHS